MGNRLKSGVDGGGDYRIENLLCVERGDLEGRGFAQIENIKRRALYMPFSVNQAKIISNQRTQKPL